MPERDRENGLSTSETHYRPYDPDLFVGYRDELDFAVRAVNEVRKPNDDDRDLNVVYESVLEITGAVGAGKTWFSLEMARLLTESGEVGGTKARVVYVDCAETQGKEDIIGALSTGLGIEEEVGIDAIVGTARQLRENGELPVFILDNSDQMAEEDLGELEEELFYRVVRRADSNHLPTAFLVTTGGSFNRWRVFEVKRRVGKLNLNGNAITGEELGSYLETASLNPSYVDIVGKQCFGHPLATASAVDAIIKAAERGEEFDERMVVAEAVHEVIEEDILASVPEDMRSFTQLLYHFRRFYAPAMRRLDPDNADNILRNIGQVHMTGLIQFVSDRGGYVFDDTQRRLLTRNEAIRNPQEYAERQERVVEFYDVSLKTNPRNADDYIIERLYAASSLAQLLPTEESNKRVDEVVRAARRQLEDVLKNPNLQWDVVKICEKLSELLDGDDEIRELITDERVEELKGFVERKLEEIQ